MNEYNHELIRQYEKDIYSFEQEEYPYLTKIKLNDLLVGKNPYFFSINNVSTTAGTIVKRLIDDYIASYEEAMLEDWLERLNASMVVAMEKMIIPIKEHILNIAVNVFGNLLVAMKIFI